MTPTVFVTGGTGFVGKHVVSALLAGGSARLVCLSRSGSGGWSAPSVAPGGVERVRWVRGELSTPDRYREALASCDRVLHLAARTGRAPRSEYWTVNVHGTEALLDAARRAGIERFVHVSTIAVHFTNLDGYPYARSKAEAESRVRESDVPHVVVRPTIVLGADGPAWRTLSSMARWPVVPLPGDAAVPVQPIHVEDLARVLAFVIRGPAPAGGAHDVGGPEPLSIGNLVRRIGRRLRGRAPRLLRIPAGPLETAIAALDRLLPVPPPVGPGQLSSFHQDGTVREGELQRRFEASLAGIDETIRRCIRGGTRSGDEAGRGTG